MKHLQESWVGNHEGLKNTLAAIGLVGALAVGGGVVYGANEVHDTHPSVQQIEDNIVYGHPEQ
jgi:hypothetical protein